MENKEALDFCLEKLENSEIDKAQCRLESKKKDEINVEWDELSLLRTMYETDLELTAIKDDKKGTLSVNQLDRETLEETVEEAVDIAESSRKDSAVDIAESQPPETFSSGPDERDLDLMYDRVKEFLNYTGESYPNTCLEGINLDFENTDRRFLNSNGVDFREEKGRYLLVIMFMSRDERKISSFNYSYIFSKDLDKPLWELGNVDKLLEQSSEQIDTEELPGTFKGDVVVTPDCMNSFLYPFTRYLKDRYIITGNSIYSDKLNETIASPEFTLHSKPVSGKFAGNYYFTEDGYRAKNTTIVDSGVLKSFLLSLYGANKTGEKRADTDGGCYEIEPGDTSYDDIISSVEEGILLCRFSGGMPSDNGDFSGVAKNSYYIRNGEIKYPLRETMISGNIAEMMENIGSISRERINLGYGIYPWIQFRDITISGK